MKYIEIIKKKKVLTLIVILVIIVAGSYLFFFKNEKVDYTVEKMIRGEVIQYISETGTLKVGEEISLSFKSSGRIEKIYVEAGDNIKVNQDLAKLDTSQLLIQLAEAQAALEVTKAKKTDTQLSLESAEKDLNNIKNKAEDDLNSAHEDALTALDDAYLKIYNAFNVAYNIQKTYFSTPNEYGLKIGEEKYRIEISLEKIEDLVGDIKSDSQYDSVGSALSEAETILEKVSNALKGIRDITDNVVYRELVSSTDKSSLDTQKLNINTVLTNIISSEQNISTVKISNTTNIDSAEAKVSTIKAQLQQGGLYQAQTNQAQAQVALIQKEIQESTLRSPTEGKVTKAEKRAGESAQPTEVVISLLPSAQFQIEADIYEEDVIRVQPGNPVDIELAAFPEEIFSGKVILINPGEKLVEGVVYYEVTIDIDNFPQGIKQGMTADVRIKTAQRDNVLVVTEEALIKKDDKEIVEVLKGKKTEEREIKTGLRGTDGIVEVISGLGEGEQVIIRQ